MPNVNATTGPDTEAPVYRPGQRVAVLLPLPLDGAYDYVVPPGLTLCRGAVVRVPLGRRQMAGVVWGEGVGELADDRLKAVTGLADCPPLPDVTMRFVDWVAAYTVSAPGAVLKMVLSVPDALEPPRPVIGYRTAPALPADLRLTAARSRVLEQAQGLPLPAAELARLAGVSPGVVKGLADQGALLAIEMPPRPPFQAPDPSRPGVTLTEEQAKAAEDLAAAARQGGYAVHLLDGVPGAGKTEVYLEAVAAAVAAGRQALVMLPEIALSAQWMGRFEDRFGVEPAVWHSELGQAARRQTWRAIASGEAKVVVGARSALMLPYADLGVIIVDEEHDTSFKQDEGVVYHARDMAVVRAHLGQIPLVLASATPSLETVNNVQTGRYVRLHLPDRHAGASMPDITLVDLRSDGPARDEWISPTLARALAETVARDEQALLFLNRRGYAPLTLCRACGHRLQCPNCTAWLVSHKRTGRLQCHHCGYSVVEPEACPSCEVEGKLAACGPGIERLAEEVAARFPQARVAMADSDSIIGPQAARELVRKIEDHEVDIVIGTQIVAKGYHFPLLTLVGAVDADLGLTGGDLRAAERTFQLLYQVAGRAGRAERAGQVIIQTTMPEHPVMAALASGDRDRFIAAEADARRDGVMPPFGRLAAIIVSGQDEAAVDEAARALGRAAPRENGIHVFGPAPAPLALLRGQHRRRLLLRAPRTANVPAVVRAWLARVGVRRNIRVRVDVDPISFL